MENLNCITALTDWYTTNHGRQLYHYEEEQLSQLLPNCFGYQLLQIGGPTNLQWLSSSPIKHPIVLTTEIHRNNMPNAFCANPAQLPFQSESIDTVFLPHVLECVTNQEVILNEACRVLVPGGFLIISGLNRASLWGLQHQYRMLRTKNPHFPWFQQFASIYNIQRVLLNNNCVIDTTNIGCYQPLNLNSAELIKEHSFWDVMGAIAWSAFGAIYVILARKQIHGMTPIWDKNLRSTLYEVKIGLAQQRNINDDKAN